MGVKYPKETLGITLVGSFDILVIRELGVLFCVQFNIGVEILTSFD